MKISGVNIGSRLKHIFTLWSRVLTITVSIIIFVKYQLFKRTLVGFRSQGSRIRFY